MAEPTEAQRKRSQARERRRGQAAPAENQPGDGVTEGGEEPLEAVKHAAKVAAAGAAVGAAAAAARALTSRDEEHESERAADAEETSAAEQESPKADARRTSHEPEGDRSGQPAQLADVLERVLDKGIVIAGDIQINLLDIELLTVKIRLLIASADKAREMGIDWWEGDAFLSKRNGQGELEERLRKLEEKAGLPTSPKQESD